MAKLRPIPHDLFAEIHKLVTAALENRITPEQQAGLEELVVHHPQARQIYVRYMQDTVVLDRWAARSEHADVPGKRIVSLPLSRWRSFRPVLVRLGAAAAVLLVILGAFLLLRPGPPAPTLATALACVWEHEGQPVQLGTGSELAGRWRLVAGLAELTWPDGTRVVVEGPAEFESAGPDKLRLHQGQLVVRVVPPAVGFTVFTSDAAIIDRGTEFGVRSRPGAATEVHVFQGRVATELQAEQMANSEVVEGEAAQLDGRRQGISTIPIDRLGFVRYLPVPGLLGEYYDTRDLQERVSTRVDPVIDFTDSSWEAAPPGTEVEADYKYSERWTGFVKIDRPGAWQFFTYSNDGVRLWIDKVLVVDNWTRHTEIEDKAQVDLAAGWHHVRLEHFQMEKTVAIRLSFAGPGRPKMVIPASHLSVVHPLSGEEAAASRN